MFLLQSPGIVCAMNAGLGAEGPLRSGDRSKAEQVSSGFLFHLTNTFAFRFVMSSLEDWK